MCVLLCWIGQSDCRIPYHTTHTNRVSQPITITGLWKMSESDPRLRRKLYSHMVVSHRGVIREQKYHTLFTSMFSHADGWHLFGNMFTLYFFGASALPVLGARKFLTMYLGGGIFSSLCHIAAPSVIPRSWPASRSFSQYSQALGASGAIGATVAYSILLNPTGTVLLYGLIPLPTFIFGLGYIAQDALGLYQGDTGTGNAAHLGGAFWGAATFAYLRTMGGRGKFR